MCSKQLQQRRRIEIEVSTPNGLKKEKGYYLGWYFDTNTNILMAVVEYDNGKAGGAPMSSIQFIAGEKLPPTCAPSKSKLHRKNETKNDDDKSPEELQKIVLDSMRRIGNGELQKERTRVIREGAHTYVVRVDNDEINVLKQKNSDLEHKEEVRELIRKGRKDRKGYLELFSSLTGKAKDKF